MPSYDLQCQDCGHKFSVFCSISAKEQQKCPQCQSDKLQSIFSNVNIGGKAKTGAAQQSPTPG
ncbi:MAG: zinc ribbon domain-containing protein [Clostridia bacterium]|nr:zinc ribbon domain-containing protein [Clostridia bacterium]